MKFLDTDLYYEKKEIKQTLIFATEHLTASACYKGCLDFLQTEDNKGTHNVLQKAKKTQLKLVLEKKTIQ